MINKDLLENKMNKVVKGLAVGVVSLGLLGGASAVMHNSVMQSNVKAHADSFYDTALTKGDRDGMKTSSEEDGGMSSDIDDGIVPPAVKKYQEDYAHQHHETYNQMFGKNATDGDNVPKRVTHNARGLHHHIIKKNRQAHKSNRNKKAKRINKHARKSTKRVRRNHKSVHKNNRSRRINKQVIRRNRGKKSYRRNRKGLMHRVANKFRHHFSKRNKKLNKKQAQSDISKANQNLVNYLEK